VRNDDTQLGFDSFLSDAETVNRVRQQDRETAHLPGTMAEAFPYYRGLIERHHAAMLAADIEQALALRGDAHLLAEKLNGFEPGIIADEDAPGCVLERGTSAPDGAVPLWGQCGSFEILVRDMRVRIELDGMFGIGANYMSWPGFAARAVEFEKPFLSETGYRSFIGLHGELLAGETPDAFALRAISSHVARELKGRLRSIRPEHRERTEA
jgi:hypothetical protein